MTRPGRKLSPGAIKTLAGMEWVPRTAALLVAATGALALSGWILRIPKLVQWGPGDGAMAPLTAIGLLCCGLSLGLLPGMAGAGRRSFSTAFAFITAALGLVGLAERVAGVQFRLVERTFPPLRGLTESAPERMSEVSALAFLLIGSALVLESRRRWPRWSEGLAAGAALLAAPRLIGTAFGAAIIQWVGPYGGMALDAAMAIALLALGILLAHPGRGLSGLLANESAGGVMARRVVPAALFLPVLLAWLRLLGERRGLYGTELGLALFVSVITGALVAVVLWGASALVRADEARRQTFQELRTSQERFQTLFASNTVGLMITGLDGTIFEANGAFLDLVGYTPEDLRTGRVRWDLLTPPEYEAASRQASEELRRTGSCRPFAKEYVRRDGTRVSALVGIALLPPGERCITYVMDLTEQRRAEADNAKLSALVQGSDDAIISKTLEGVITSWNGGAEKLYGFSAAEAVGTAIGFHIPPERNEEIAEILKRICAGERVEHFETVRLRKDGRRIDVSLTVSPIYDAAGAVCGASSIARDISEKKRAEISIQRLLWAVEQSSNAIFMTDLRGAISYVNPAFERIYGYSPREVLGENPRFLRSGAQGREFYADFWKRMISGRGFQGEIVNRAKDGHLVTVESTADSVWDREARRIGYIAVQNDISERKVAREALEESERRFRTLIENASDIIAVIDARGVFRYVSPSIQPTLGYAPEEAVGRNVLDYIHPEDAPKALETLTLRFREPGTPRPGEFRLRHRDGSWRTLQTRGTVLRGTGGLEGLVLNARDVTVQQRAESALRESEERYRNIVEHARAWICTHDLEGKILSVNRVAATLLGEDPSAMIGRSVQDFLAPEFRAAFPGYLSEVRDRGSARGLMTMVRSDGTRVTLEYQNSLRDGGAGGAVVDGIALEVTERIAAERALRENQKRLQHLVTSSPAVIYSLRAGPSEFAVTWMSENLERLLGYAPVEAWAPGWWAEHLHPEDRDRALAEMPQVLENGHAVRDYRFRHSNGTYRWLRDEQRLIRDNRGEPAEIVGSWSDITGRKEVESALRESESRYREIFDASPLPMWVYDVPDLRILDVNDAAVEHYGYSREEFLRMTLFDVRPPEEAARLRNQFLDRPDPPIRAHPGIWKHIRKDGTVMEIDVHTRSVEFGGKRMRLGVMLDVTDQKRLEEQFRQAQKMEAIGLLAGGIAHDFNNLLTAILGYADLAADRLPVESRVREDVEEIRKAGGRAAALTRQLLAFSRKQVLEPRVTNLNELVSGLEHMLRRLLGEDITLLTLLAPRLQSVLADPGQLEQVIVNLAVNSRDAMPAGGHLTIETANVELDELFSRRHTGAAPGRFVMIAVSDTGIGMDAATRARIFEPFFTTKERGRGTGLGLSTVYGIIKQSGGYVWVYSEPGKGTTMKIYLPPCAESPEAVTAEPAGEPPRGNETVLLVEDEPAVRALTRELLERLGYVVLDATGGSEALAIARSHAGPIHLLLTDVVMPGLGGAELVGRIRAVLPELRVLYMSGYTDDAIVRHGFLDGDHAFLQKPFTSEALARKIREALTR